VARVTLRPLIRFRRSLVRRLRDETSPSTPAPDDRGAVSTSEGGSSVVVVTANNLASYGLLALIALATSRFLGPSGRGVVVLFTTTAAFTLLLSAMGTNIAARVWLVSEADAFDHGRVFGSGAYPSAPTLK
jgi:hypothetical protein